MAKSSHSTVAPSAQPTDSFERLIREFERLPGVGRRSAERMAYSILGQKTEDAMKLAVAIRDVKQNLKPCGICGDLTEKPRCAICDNPERDAGLICVVEWPREVRALEKSKQFNGHFHVLMGRLSPLSGVEPSDLRVAELLGRVKAGSVRELILATSPSVEGDATASFIAAQVKAISNTVTLTRLARGVAEGSDLTFAQSGTLGEALKGRVAVQ